jgi:molybdopterin-guanine dinucleotide biosynthesis protein A
MGSASFHNFVVACDLPFISPALIKYMAGLKDGFDVVVPKLKRGYETLLAIYSKDCLPIIKEIIAGGNLKVINLFPKIRLKKITEKEIREFGSPDILFRNINTPQDLNRILPPCSSMAMAGR